LCHMWHALNREHLGKVIVDGAFGAQVHSVLRRPGFDTRSQSRPMISVEKLALFCNPARSQALHLSF
jgi:hypothetical protein